MSGSRRSVIKADLVLVATFFLSADDFVAIPLRPGDLVHRAAHRTLMHHDFGKAFRAGFRRLLTRPDGCPPDVVSILVLLLDAAATQCEFHLPLAPLALSTSGWELPDSLCRCCFSQTLSCHLNQVSGDEAPY